MATVKFKPEGEKALARKPLFVKVPEEILEAVENIPYGDRGKWLRRVVSEAAERELIDKK